MKIQPDPTEELAPAEVPTMEAAPIEELSPAKVPTEEAQPMEEPTEEPTTPKATISKPAGEPDASGSP